MMGIGMLIRKQGAAGRTRPENRTLREVVSAFCDGLQKKNRAEACMRWAAGLGVHT